jgi:hypothetical protein
VNSEAVVAEHVKEGSLASVIQTEEDNLGILLVETFLSNCRLG